MTNNQICTSALIGTKELLLPISRFVLDKKFQQNDSKFAKFYIGIGKPKVAFSVFHFVLLYIFA